MVGQSFSDVCPLLLTSSNGYSQHVRVGTDLQLTTSNLPPVVSYITNVYPITDIECSMWSSSRSQASHTCVLLVELNYKPLGTMPLVSLVM